ncbi:MAG: GNAT family N-acetyltransferase [Bacteroidetes bacterium HGW-Bacteroidetes-19]|nr:MAG: GNAT family N-acetyltransferase [Bacteroidetes bacterium HGW-Bacteroidetes-20]PKP28247.1 MAG: GNAT family N-acetyltransferase [Bacteroidetes bacterium HGW-Bacteroidetes-19]
MITNWSTLRIQSSQDSRFEETWELYQSSFPPHEQRPLFVQKWTLRKPEYHCDIILQNEQLIALLFWWEIDTFRFIEHFAINQNIRNQGIGTQLIKEFISLSEQHVLLEVEPEQIEVNLKRIRFYERLSFEINPFPYAQPSFRDGEPPIPLHLMSYPKQLTQEQFIRSVKSIYKTVYGIS